MTKENKNILNEDEAGNVNGGSEKVGDYLGEDIPIFHYDIPEPEELNPETLLLKHF